MRPLSLSLPLLDGDRSMASEVRGYGRGRSYDGELEAAAAANSMGWAVAWRLRAHRIPSARAPARELRLDEGGRRTADPVAVGGCFRNCWLPCPAMAPRATACPPGRMATPGRPHAQSTAPTTPRAALSSTSSVSPASATRHADATRRGGVMHGPPPYSRIGSDGDGWRRPPS
jgi:hypothetical protein